MFGLEEIGLVVLVGEVSMLAREIVAEIIANSITEGSTLSLGGAMIATSMPELPGNVMQSCFHSADLGSYEQSFSAIRGGYVASCLADYAAVDQIDLRSFFETKQN
jgi:hypothetical protein